VDEEVYDISLEMLHKLKDLPERIRVGIADLIDYNFYMLPELDGYSQAVGGVIKGDPPFFFELEYVREEHKNIVMLDMEEITLDEYLDYIDNDQTLRQYEQETNEGIEDTIQGD
jgi:hypothetical protein